MNKIIKKYTPELNVYVVEIIVTSECNQKCVYCISGMPSRKCTEHLCVTSIPKILNYLQYILDNDCFGRDELRVSIIGGEPTLYPYLNYLHDSINKMGLAIGLITNAFDARILDTLDLSNTVIVATYHNGFAEKDFDTWYAELIALKDKCRELRIHMLSTPYNIIKQYANLQKIDHDRVMLIPIDTFRDDPSYIECSRMFSTRFDLVGTAEYTDGTIETKAFTDCFLRNEFFVKGYTCIPNTIFIDVDGSVYNCANDMDSYKSIFNIADSEKYGITKNHIICPYLTCGCGDQNYRESNE